MRRLTACRLNPAVDAPLHRQGFSPAALELFRIFKHSNHISFHDLAPLSATFRRIALACAPWLPIVATARPPPQRRPRPAPQSLRHPPPRPAVHLRPLDVLDQEFGGKKHAYSTNQKVVLTSPDVAHDFLVLSIYRPPKAQISFKKFVFL